MAAATPEPITLSPLDTPPPVNPEADQAELLKAINSASDKPPPPTKWNDFETRSPRQILLAQAGIASLPPGFMLEGAPKATEEKSAAEPKEPTPPEGFVLEKPQAAPPKKSMFDVINGPSLSAREAPKPDKYDRSVGLGEFLLNAVKKGAMALPGLPGTLVGVKEQLAPGTEAGTMGARVSEAMSEIPAIGPILKLIEHEQLQQKKGEQPFLSGEYLAQKLLGAQPEMKPPSKGAEIAGDIAEFMASAPGGVAKSVVTKGVVPAARELSKLFAISSGAVAGGEVAQASMGEGPGVKAAGELAAIPLIAAGPLKWASWLTKEGRDIGQQAIGDIKGTAGVNALVQQAAQNRLAKGIQEYPASIANIKEATDLQARINAAIDDGTVQLTAGRATGSPRVVADEFAARRSSAEAVANSIEQDKRNAAAVLSYMNLDEKANISRKAAIDGQINAYNQKLAELTQGEQDIQRQAERVAASTTPKMTPTERGQTLLEQRAAIKQKQDAVAASLYGAARSEAQRIGADFSPDAIQLKARELSANPILAYDETNLPSVIRNVRTLLAGEQGQVGPSLAELGLSGRVADIATAAPKRLSFDQITSLREAVNQDIAGELRSTNPNKLQRLRALTDMKNTVNGAIAESEHDSVKQLFGAANNYYRDTYAPMFNKGINAKLAMKDSFGEQKVIDEKILDQYVTSPTNATRFVTLFGKNPEALATMEDHLLDKFSKAVVKNGVVDPARYRLWTQKNAPVLQVLDAAGVKSLSRFQNIKTAVQELSDRQKVLQDTQKIMAKDELTKLLGTSDHGTIVENALAKPAAMGRLTNALGQEGSKALAVSTMRDLMSKITYPPGGERIGVNWGALQKWLKDNGTSASIMFKRAFGDKDGAAHLQRLKDGSRMMEIMDRVKTPTTIAAESAIGKDPFREKIGVGFRTLFNMLRAVKAGRTSEADMAVTLGGQSGSFFLVKAYNEMLQSMASDPESSKMLLTLAKTGGKPVLTKDMAKARAQAVAGMLGKAGYYWFGGRYYGPSLRTLAPMMAQQQTEQR